MIKDLIAKLTNEKITLSSALKQSKVVFNYSSDNLLGAFIEKELNGYNTHEDFPDYRIVPAIPTGTFRSQWDGQVFKKPFLYKNVGEKVNNAMFNRKVVISIPEIENILQNDKGEILEMFPQNTLETHRELSPVNGFILQDAAWVIQPVSLANIVSRTQDQLTDILLRLTLENSALEKDLNYMIVDKDSTNKTYQTTVHGSIIGSNFGVGDKLTQKDITINNNPDVNELLKKIISLGFNKSDVSDLAVLIEEKKTSGISTKIFDWLGKMAVKAAVLGLEHQIPTLIATVSAYIHSTPS